MKPADSLAPVTPADLTKVSFAYRCRVWIAMLGLLLFVALYIGLAGWFTWTAYRMTAAFLAGGDGATPAFFAALPAAFLAIFMTALAFRNGQPPDPYLEKFAELYPDDRSPLDAVQKLMEQGPGEFSEETLTVSTTSREASCWRQGS